MISRPLLLYPRFGLAILEYEQLLSFLKKITIIYDLKKLFKVSKQSLILTIVFSF